MIFAVISLQFAVISLQFAGIILQFAVIDLQFAVISLQFAVIDLQNAHLLWNDRLPFLGGPWITLVGYIIKIENLPTIASEYKWYAYRIQRGRFS